MCLFTFVWQRDSSKTNSEWWIAEVKSWKIIFNLHSIWQRWGSWNKEADSDFHLFNTELGGTALWMWDFREQFFFSFWGGACLINQQISTLLTSVPGPYVCTSHCRIRRRLHKWCIQPPTDFVYCCCKMWLHNISHQQADKSFNNSRPIELARFRPCVMKDPDTCIDCIKALGVKSHKNENVYEVWFSKVALSSFGPAHF